LFKHHDPLSRPFTNGQDLDDLTRKITEDYQKMIEAERASMEGQSTRLRNRQAELLDSFLKVKEKLAKENEVRPLTGLPTTSPTS
jgi:hypothetical protein